MSYIKNKEHLFNIIKKIINLNSYIIDGSQLLDLDVYYKLSDLNILDSFVIDLQKEPTILHEDKFLEWKKTNYDFFMGVE